MISSRVVYLVEVRSRSGPPIEMLAVGAEVDGAHVTFNDTIRQRCLEGCVQQETPDGFVWRRKCKSLEGYDVDETLVFRVLTVKECERRVRPNVEGNPPRFASDAELHEYYRRQFLGA